MLEYINFLKLLFHRTKAINIFAKFCRILWWQFYKRVVNKPYDLILIDDIRLRCYPNSHFASLVIYERLPEYEEMTFLLRYCRTEDIFLDIGANIGVYALLAAAKIKKGKIYCFEPSPQSYKKILENIELNSLTNIFPQNAAIGERDGFIRLALAGASEMHCIDLANDNKSEVVQMKKLDTFFKNMESNEAINISLGKLDIEGYSLHAFRGAVSMLEKHQPPVWIMELNDLSLKYGVSKREIADFLKSYGYELYKYNVEKNFIYYASLDELKTGNVLAVYDPDMVNNRLSANMLLAKK